MNIESDPRSKISPIENLITIVSTQRVNKAQNKN